MAALGVQLINSLVRGKITSIMNVINVEQPTAYGIAVNWRRRVRRALLLKMASCLPLLTIIGISEIVVALSDCSPHSHVVAQQAPLNRK